MKPSDRFWRYAGIPIIVLLVAGCCCISVGINTLGWFGDALKVPLRWLNPRGSGQDLYEILNRRQSAGFKLGEDCRYSSARGSEISSASENPAQDMDSDAVISLADLYLSHLSFTAQDGELTLFPSTPVRYELLSNRSVAIFADQESGGERSYTGSLLEGTIQGDVFRGIYARSERTSAVSGGVGQEGALEYQVSFSCPLIWLDD
jgi:hypothetical protein